MSLLPSSPDITPDSEPRVIGLDSEEADDLMAALSSETARRILSALHEEPAPPGELADRIGTSLQNAQYHLGKLEEAGAIEIVGTAYSEKGREMSVYGPADRPLVIFSGGEDRASGLRAAVSRLFGGILALGVGSLAVQELFGESLFGDNAVDDGTAGDDTAGNGASPESEPEAEDGDVGSFGVESDEPEPSPSAEPTPEAGAEDAAPEAADGISAVFDGLFAGGMPPGLAFFLGGLVVLTIVVGVTYLRTRS